MRNRAKCKKCKTIIESLTKDDWVYCECTEIGISGGSNNYRCFAGDFSNFLRVDDEGNEIVVLYKEEKQEEPVSVKDLEDEVLRLIETVEKLPDSAKLISINHYDYLTLLYLLSTLLKMKA